TPLPMAPVPASEYASAAAYGGKFYAARCNGWTIAASSEVKASPSRLRWARLRSWYATFWWPVHVAHRSWSSCRPTRDAASSRFAGRLAPCAAVFVPEYVTRRSDARRACLVALRTDSGGQCAEVLGFGKRRAPWR